MRYRWHRGLRAALGAALLAAAPAAHAAPGIEQLLERAFRNPRSVAHTGTVKVTAPGQADATVRVVCDGHGRERREHQDGPARGLVVLTDGRGTWQRAADDRLWAVLPPAPQEDSSWDSLRRNYQFTDGGKERIAGRMAQGVTITPRHPGNPRQVLWLDSTTALVLRAESYSYAGRPALTSVYTSLALGAPKGAALAPPAAEEVQPAVGPALWEACASRADMERRLGYKVALPARLPPGYSLVACYARGCQRGGLLPVVRYGDGLNALTLFVTHGQGQGPGMGRGAGRGRGWGWRGGRGPGGGRGACRLEQVGGQQVATTTYQGYRYVLVGDHRPEGLVETLESLP